MCVFVGVESFRRTHICVLCTHQWCCLGEEVQYFVEYSVFLKNKSLSLGNCGRGSVVNLLGSFEILHEFDMDNLPHADCSGSFYKNQQ